MTSSPHLFISVKADGSFDDQLRQSVRSWVTKVQHSRQRERCLQEQQSAVDKDPRSCNTLPCSNFRSRSVSSEDAERRDHYDKHGVAPEQWTFMSVHPAKQATTAARQQVRAHVTRRQHKTRREVKRSRPDSTFGSVVVEHPTPSTPAEEKPGIPPEPPLRDPSDMIHVYSENLQTDAATLWSYYLFQERQHGRMFRLQCGHFMNSPPGCLHPLILSDQAMLATTALFTGCYIRYMQSEPTIMSPALLRIRSLAYNFVQAAIDRELTDTTIIAVIKLALFESIFGHRAAYQVHMQGIAQMVQLRKKLSNMEMGGFTAHLLVWFDSNLSRIAKTPLYLTGVLPLASISDVIEAERDSFLLGMRRERLEKMRFSCY